VGLSRGGSHEDPEKQRMRRGDAKQRGRWAREHAEDDGPQAAPPVSRVWRRRTSKQRLGEQQQATGEPQSRGHHGREDNEGEEEENKGEDDMSATR